MHDHALADPTHITHNTPHRPTPKPIHPRRHRNWPPPTWHALEFLNARTNDPQDPTPHRFDSWQLRHDSSRFL
jgi:hypothetical protein